MIKKFGYNFVIVGIFIFCVSIIITATSANFVLADGNRCKECGYKCPEHERCYSRDCPVHKSAQKEEDDGSLCEECRKYRHAMSKQEGGYCAHECPIHRRGDSAQKEKGDDEEKCEKCGHVSSKKTRDCIRRCLTHMCSHMRRCEQCGQISSKECSSESERQMRCPIEGKKEEMSEKW